MSFPRYDSYTDSGIEWLGAVPHHWKIKPLKQVVSMASGEQITGESIEAVADYPVFGGNGLRGYTSAFTHDGHYALIGRQGALCGNINFAHGKFWASEHAVVVSPKVPCTVRWLGELLRTMNLGQYSITAAQPGLSVDVIATLRIPVPSSAEQSLIGAFLDRETGKIDMLVEAQRQLIDLLKEKRQAVISHAVTKGLDLTAPMKPSGVEWLGEVPAHWQVTKLKHLASLKSGGTPSKDNLGYWSGDIPWASAKDLKSDELADTIDHITETAIADGAAQLAPPGSVVVLVRGMMLARTFPVVRILVPMAINQDLKALNGRQGVSNEYLAWLLRGTAPETLNRLDEAGHGTKALRMEAWLSMPVPLPPLAEQEQIVAFIRTELGKLDALVTETTTAVTLLQERRSALISAAVTGRIDVRSLALAEADAA